MKNFFSKEQIIVITTIVFGMMVQSNYFATKLDLANLKIEMLQLQTELKQYTDESNKEILQSVENKFQILSNKIDKMR